MVRNLFLSLSLILACVTASFALAPAPLPNGSQALAYNQNTVTLDAAPPGATQLVVTVDWVNDVQQFGVENMDDQQAVYADYRLTSGFSLNDGSTPVVQDRSYTYVAGNLAVFDGTTDCAGTSGISTTNWVAKTAGPVTYTFSTAPTTLDFVRRWPVNGNLGSPAICKIARITATVSWAWQ